MSRRLVLRAAIVLTAFTMPGAIAGNARAAQFVAPEPRYGEFLDSDRAAAIVHGEATRGLAGAATESNCTAFDAVRPPWRGAAPRPEYEALLNSEDDDACHYARGHTLLFHVFIDHNLGSWSDAERNAAAAKAALAKQWYVDEAPADANMDFDNLGGSGYYYYQTGDLNFDADTLSGVEVESVIASFGFADTDGDGTRLDEFAFYWQNWNGGYDNVIVVFQPADAIGRANALIEMSRIIHYTDDSWFVWRHEMGHNFGSCDEYGPDGCNSCAVCSGRYHITAGINGNCQNAACGTNQACVMDDNVDAHCTFTEYHWGWDDTDVNGLLDTMKRQTTLNNYVNVLEMFHNGYYNHTTTTSGFVAAQQWDSWAVFGVRPPSGSDYDLTMYHDNNHNFQVASSAASGSQIDFIVGDYNHSRSGNEHFRLNLFSGPSNSYNMTWESGTGTLYPNGAFVGTQNWEDYNVVRAYEVPLFGGETITFTLDVQTAGLNMGFALYKSNGAAYYAGRSAAVASANANGNGLDESFTYEVPSDDVYGLVVWSENEVAGTFDIRIGPAPATLTDDVSFLSSLALRLFDYDPVVGYWGVLGVRPLGTSDAELSVFDDVNYQTFHETSNYAGTAVDFVAVDYNHASTAPEYLRVWRDAGADNHRTEFEQGTELLDGYEPFTWPANDVADIWDTFLTSGVPYFFREYHNTLTGFDSGIYLMGSAGADHYQSRDDFLQYSNIRAMNVGGEWFAHTPAATDWYGLVVLGNDENPASSGSIWVGRHETLTSDIRFTRTEEVQFDIVTPTDSYWNVVATRPTGADIADVQLFEDSGYGTFLANSLSPGVNFVVGDWNHNPQATVYPRIRRTSGAGGVDIEFEGDADAIVPPLNAPYQESFSWTALDVAEVYDLWIPGGGVGGKTVAIMVESLTGDLDLGFELFKSNGAEYFAGRLGGVVSADALGNGGTEGTTYHATTSDYYGLVVYNKNDNGGTWRLTIYYPDAVAVEGGLPAPAMSLVASPNPSYGIANLEFVMPVAGEVQVDVFDLQGRLMKSLASGHHAAGRHAVQWDGRDGSGARIPAGVYLARMRANGEERRIKLVRGE